ncbi:MAG: hypothetical protein ACON5A_05580 [Candidatus Comchoanobacterales bacterium]
MLTPLTGWMLLPLYAFMLLSLPALASFFGNIIECLNIYMAIIVIISFNIIYIYKGWVRALLLLIAFILILSTLNLIGFYTHIDF